MVANRERTMPEQPEYYDKYMEMRFQRIDEAIVHIDQKVAHIDQRVSHIDQKVDQIEQKVESFKAEIKAEVNEIKRDNKTTRWWVTGTGMAVIFGIAAIFFAFAQLQTSWRQQVISFAGKAIK